VRATSGLYAAPVFAIISGITQSIVTFFFQKKRLNLAASFPSFRRAALWTIRSKSHTLQTVSTSLTTLIVPHDLYRQ
jgi:hypothetical protein